MKLERDVYGFLSFQFELANEKDEITRKLLFEDAIEVPQEYLLLRRLKMFSGPYGGLPFLVEGGWLDQPHLTLRVLEACIAGERLFEDFLKQINEQAMRQAINNVNLEDSFDAPK